MKRKFVLVSLIGMILFLVACNLQRSGDSSTLTGDSTPVATSLGNKEAAMVSVEGEPVILDREQMIEQADLNFQGIVKDISPTRWNQDSGEYWEESVDIIVPEDRVVVEDGTIPPERLTDAGIRVSTHLIAWPVHEITLSVEQPIVDEIGVGKEVTLTLIGTSPIDETMPASEQAVKVTNPPKHSLRAGDVVIVFAIQADLQWRELGQPIRTVTTAEGNVKVDVGSRTILNFISVPDNSYLVRNESGLDESPPGASLVQEPISLTHLSEMVTEGRK